MAVRSALQAAILFFSLKIAFWKKMPVAQGMIEKVKNISLLQPSIL